MATRDIGLTVGVLGTRAMLAHARSAGVDTDALVRELGLARDALEDPDARIPLALDQRAWALAAARSGDRAFGLSVAQAFELGTFEAMDYAMWASETLGDALDRLVRFFRLIGDDAALRVEPRGREVHLVRDSVHDLPERAECFLAALFLRSRALTEGQAVARAVRFTHPPPANARPYRAFFKCAVHFGAAASELVLDGAAFGLTIRSAQPGLARILDRYMRDLVARLPEPGPFVRRVQSAIARSLGGGRPSLAATARVLHASPRTVQRRLQELGLTHRGLIDQVRRELAPRLLETPKLSLTEVAYLLGFEDVSGFYRAHRRWTGVAPTRRRSSRA